MSAGGGGGLRCFPDYASDAGGVWLRASELDGINVAAKQRDCSDICWALIRVAATATTPTLLQFPPPADDSKAFLND